MNEIKKTLLEMLLYFKKVCDENNIWYSLACGTLLGAVREKNFIEWDDDADVVVRISDLEIIRKAFLDKDNDSYEYINSDVANRCTQSHDSIISRKNGVNLSLDIYPLIGAPSSKNKQICFIKKTYITDKIYRSKYKKIRDCKKKNRFLVFFAKIIDCFIADKTIRKRINKDNNKYSFLKSDYVLIHSNDGNKTACMLKQKWLETDDCSFCGVLFKIPKDYDYILTRLYGSDYNIPKKY